VVSKYFLFLLGFLCWQCRVLDDRFRATAGQSKLAAMMVEVFEQVRLDFSHRHPAPSVFLNGVSCGWRCMLTLLDDTRCGCILILPVYVAVLACYLLLSRSGRGSLLTTTGTTCSLPES
jgi:hypothetical protein